MARTALFAPRGAQARSTVAVLAILGAVVAFFLAPLGGFFLALFSILLGILGWFRSLSPRTSGGLLSIGAIVLGVVAMVAKILQGALGLLF